MKQWMNLSLVLSAWALYVSAAPTEKAASAASVEDVCSMLSSLSNEGKMLTQFNGVFFGDFTSGKNSGSQGPLAIGGSIKGQNAQFNTRNRLSCPANTDSIFSDHGLILKGFSEAPIQVNGHVDAYKKDNISTTSTTCSIKESAKSEFDFDQTRTNAMKISQQMANMLPNWNIDSTGVIVNIVAEGITVKQPFNLFSMPVVCGHGACEAKSFFDCNKKDRKCQVPTQALSDVHAMMLGDGTWTGPVDQVFPKDKMVVFNVPVIDGQTFDIKTNNPSAGLNACNTLYNFYAVDQEGVYYPEGKITIKRNSREPLSGMILAPQAHIIDTARGSFSGQIIADSYESKGEGAEIKDFIASGNEACQSFVGCAANNKDKPVGLVRRQAINNDAESTEQESINDTDKITADTSTTPTEVANENSSDPWRRHKTKQWIHQWDSGKKKTGSYNKDHHGDSAGDAMDDYDYDDKEEEEQEWKNKGVDPEKYDKNFDFGGKYPHKKPAHRFDYYYEDEEEEHF